MLTICFTVVPLFFGILAVAFLIESCSAYSYSDDFDVILGFVLVLLFLPIGLWNTIAWLDAHPESHKEKDYTVVQLVKEVEKNHYDGLILEKGKYPKYLDGSHKYDFVTTVKYDPKGLLKERSEDFSTYRHVTEADLADVVDNGKTCHIQGLDKLNGRCYVVGNTATIQLER